MTSRDDGGGANGIGERRNAANGGGGPTADDVVTTDRRSALRALGAGGLLPLLPVGDAAASDDAPPTVAWSRLFDGNGGGDAFSALARAPDCGFVLAGSTTPGGGARGEAWLVKATPTGAEEWRHATGGAHTEARFTDVVTVPNVGYGAVGYRAEFAPPDVPEAGERYPTSGWYFETDFAGDRRVSESYASPTDSAVDSVFESLVRAPDGTLAMAGRVDDFPEGAFGRGWLQETTSAGARRWAEQYTPPASGWRNTFNSHVRTADGGYALAGSVGGPSDRGWLMKTGPGGAAQWERTVGTDADARYSFADIVRTDDGGYALAGTAAPYDGGSRGWLVKVDASGAPEWERTFGDDGSFSSLIRTEDGGYAAVGTTDDEVGDGWVLKTTADGTREWDRRLGWEGEFARLSDVLQTGDGGYVAAGARGVRPDSGDGWLVKLG